jgi:hypothetical protein
MPEISDDELKEFRSQQSKIVGLELDNAKSSFLAENPHVPVSLVKAYQGDPTGLGDFGKVLLEQFPKPQAAPQPSPAAPAVAPVAAPPPVATSQVPVPPPPAATPPIMATQFPAPLTPQAQQLAYDQQVANGGRVQIPGMVPAPAPVPSPGSADALTAQNAIKAQSETIRERMRIGVATPAEVQWISQWGEHGFTAAMTAHARKVHAVVGRG